MFEPKELKWIAIFPCSYPLSLPNRDFPLLGDTIAMDLATVHHGNEFLKYNVSLNGYGYYGDCLVDSERNRWMGPKRYDWAGMLLSIRLKLYLSSKYQTCSFPVLFKTTFCWLQFTWVLCLFPGIAVIHLCHLIFIL